MRSKAFYRLLTVVIYAGLYASLFWAAGTWNLPFFWATLGVQTVAGFTGIFFVDKDLLAERMHPPKGTDKDPYGRHIISVLYLAQVFIAALDVGRYHWSDSVPMIVQVLALIPVTIGWAGMMWSMAVNKFFSSAIRLQPDRGQSVIMEGPYHSIRHPGYAFASLALLFQSLSLGSWLSLVPGMLIVLDLMYRTTLEEKLLTRDLPGYKEYTEKVRNRWLPGLW